MVSFASGAALSLPSPLPPHMCTHATATASTLLRWLQLRTYVLARKKAPIEAPKPLFVFMLLAFLVLVLLVGAEVRHHLAVRHPAPHIALTLGFRWCACCRFCS